MATPEDQAREQIDRQLEATGWVVQDNDRINLSAKLGVAVREFPLSTGKADYMLFVNGRAAGVLEARAVGTTLMEVTTQSENIRPEPIRSSRTPGAVLYLSPTKSLAS